MRVLLTGATGFLGSHLLKALVSKGYEVVVLKRSTSDMWRLKGFENTFKSYDIDRVSLQTAFEEQPIDIVIHTACVYGRKGESIQKILETNLMFGIQLLNTAINFNLPRLVRPRTLFGNDVQEPRLFQCIGDICLTWLPPHNAIHRVPNLVLTSCPHHGAIGFTRTDHGVNFINK